MVLEQAELKQRLGWLVNLRWGGIIGVLVTTHVVREVAVLSFSLIPVYLILGTSAACNLLYKWRLKFPRENLKRQAILQIVLDQIVLALAVYFSGGCDSPFIYFFIFHVVISGIILPGRYAFAFGGTAVLLPLLVLGLKHLGVLPHYGIFKNEPIIFSDMTVIGSYGLAFISTVFLTAYFVTYLSKRLYEKNEEVLRLYTLSERLRSSIRLKEVIEIIERELRGFVGATSSVYLPLNKDRRVLSLKVEDRELQIPLIDKNSLSDAVLRGVAMIVDERIVTSDYEIKALDLIGAKRCMVLPVMAAALQPCHEYFQCADPQCAAYGNKGGGRCWLLSGSHCKGAIYGSYLEKLMACLSCELFTPVGAYVLNIPKEYLPLANVDMEASMRLLDAAGLAVSNALLYEKTMQMSKTDGLTGLKNHREFKEAFQAESLRAKRYNGRFTLVMLDVDHFKNYNDANGHPQGDVLLKKMAELIRDNLKETDIVARYGGEEFAILLLETAKDHGIIIAERLLGMIDWYKFPKEKTQPNGKVTVSIGVSGFPDDGDTAEAVLQAADDALYRAKRDGRNRVAAAGK
jgi:diguanylate cyclase (GGDEF)-like protein